MSDLIQADGTLDLDAVREHLLAELGLLLGRQAKITSHLHNVDESVPTDWQEAAQHRENDEVLEALADSGRDRISALRNALQRLDDDTYGVCTVCEDEIDPRRVAAMPTTTRCVKCATI